MRHGGPKRAEDSRELDILSYEPILVSNTNDDARSFVFGFRTITSVSIDSSETNPTKESTVTVDRECKTTKRMQVLLLQLVGQWIQFF